MREYGLYITKIVGYAPQNAYKKAGHSQRKPGPFLFQLELLHQITDNQPLL